MRLIYGFMLYVDETVIKQDGEFACELVLQDNELPLQIRLTIHEGGANPPEKTLGVYVHLL